MGWIKLDRKIQDNFLWKATKAEPFDKRSAWIDLLLLANHEDTQILFNGQFKIIKRGQHLTSIRVLSERWKWSKDKVLRFFAILRDAGMVKTDTHSATLLTIVNYDKFQSWCDSDEDTNKDSGKDSGKDTHDTQTRNKEYKNRRNMSYFDKREEQERILREYVFGKECDADGEAEDQ